MTNVTLQQTPAGWRILVTEGDSTIKVLTEDPFTVRVTESRFILVVNDDDDAQPIPLDVKLGT